MTIINRTGLGRNLTAAEVDMNFASLLADDSALRNALALNATQAAMDALTARVAALEAGGAVIRYITAGYIAAGYYA